MARTVLASLLENGTLARVWPAPLSRAVGAMLARGIARPLAVPVGLRVITVGGATLGGSGKTRVAVSVARVLADAGACVVLVGHAYRAAPRRARVVPANGDARVLLAAVGDEALASATDLGTRARVVVAPSRQEAIDFAASLVPRPDVVVLDGPLQLAPVRASLALLAVDAVAPWGADALPPAGDRRAPREALLAAADHVVPVTAMPPAAALAGLRDRRVGLFTALARPERLREGLTQAGVAPLSWVRAPDHGPLDATLVTRLRHGPVDLWLATGKCAVHLEAARLGPALLIVRLPVDTALPEAVVASVLRVARAAAGAG